MNSSIKIVLIKRNQSKNKQLLKVFQKIEFIHYQNGSNEVENQSRSA